MSASWLSLNLCQPIDYYYHYDGLGSIIALTDMDGKIVETYEYDAFGKTVIRNKSGTQLSKSAIGNRYMFTARELDLETGLYYYRARYFSPAMGRFLQPDPIGYKGGFNFYAYCGNNPIILIDPYGLFGWTNVAGYAKGVGGLCEAFAGGFLGVATSWTGIGAVAGGAVMIHGADVAAAGFTQGYTGEVVDSYTARGLQAMGASRGTANLVDTGISVAGSAGTGIVRGGVRSAAIASENSGWQSVLAWEKGSTALSDETFKALGGASTSPIYKAQFVSSGFNLGKAISLTNTGLTPLAELGVGTAGAGLTAASGIYNYGAIRTSGNSNGIGGNYARGRK